jgi:hypothetical protein
MSPNEPDDARPITEWVAEALAKHGVNAVVVEKNNGLEMFGKDGKPIWVDAANDIAQWGTISSDIKERKANSLASRLAYVYKLENTTESGSRFPPLEKWMPLGIGLAIGVALLIGYRTLGKEAPQKPALNPELQGESQTERQKRLARACEATRAMLWNGGNWGAMPLEGWTVELWLARKSGEPIAKDAAVIAMVTGDKLSPSADEIIAAQTDGIASLEDASALPSITGVKLVLREGYARPFFEFDKRDRFVALGDRLQRETKADHGALWARCAHLGARDVGPWFHGKNASGVATTLLWSLGLPPGPKNIDHIPAGNDFAAIEALTSSLDAEKLSTLLRDHGARTATADGATLLFPFDGQTRAAQASKHLAKELGSP